MKKIFFTLIAIMLALPSNAQYSETSMCAVAPNSAPQTIGNFISNVTGVNFLFTKAAELIIQKELKKQLNSNFNVEIQSFGGKNFIDGKFKSIEVESKKIASNDINATNFSAKSICDYNQITLIKDQIYFNENFLMNFNTEITSDDLTKTILSPFYLQMINKADFSIGSITLFKLHSPSAEIKNNRIHMGIKVDIGGLLTSRTQLIDLDAGLGVEDGKIMFTDIKLNNMHNLNIGTILPLINRLNPFVVKTKIDDHNIATIKIKNVSIKNNIINANGIVILPKSNYIPK